MGKAVLPAGFNFHILIVNYRQPLEGRSVRDGAGETGSYPVTNKIEV